MQLELVAAAGTTSPQNAPGASDTVNKAGKAERTGSGEHSGDFSLKLRQAGKEPKAKAEAALSGRPTTTEDQPSDSANGDLIQALQLICSNIVNLEAGGAEMVNVGAQDIVQTCTGQVEPESVSNDLKMMMLIKNPGVNMLKVKYGISSTEEKTAEQTAITASDEEILNTALLNVSTVNDSVDNNDSVAAITPDGEEPDNSVAALFKGKLMFNQSKNKTPLKVEAKTITGQEQMVEENGDSDQVKKLIDFESRKLTGEKLEVDPQQESKPQLTSKTDQGSDNRVAHAFGKENVELPKGAEKVNTSQAGGRFIPVDSDEVFDQIVDRAKVMVKQNLSEMKLDLKPEFLGRMTIKVLVDEGVVTARFITESPQVKQMLESNLNTLRQNLEMNGIKVEKTEVNVQLDNSGLMNDFGSSSRQNWAAEQQQRTYSFNGELPLEVSLDPEIPEVQALDQQPYRYDNPDSQLSFLV